MTSEEPVAVSMGHQGKMEWMITLTAKAQLRLLWEDIKETLLPLGCSQCGCSCPQSPGNLLILLLFLIWQFRRKRHQWLLDEQDESQDKVVPFLFSTSPNSQERARSWKPQSWEGVLFPKEKKEEEKERKDEEKKKEDLLKKLRLEPWCYFHPRKMEAGQKASFIQTKTLGTPNEVTGNMLPSFWGPYGTYQPLGGSKVFQVKKMTPDPNSRYLHSPTGLIQAPTTLQVLNNLCPLSTSNAKAKGSTQLYWGLPSLHSESLGATFSRSGCTFPIGAINQQPSSDSPPIFFNEFSSLPLPHLLVKTVSLPPPYLPSISPLPALYGNCRVTDVTSHVLPNGPEAPKWASECQDPTSGPLLPLPSPSYSPVKTQEDSLMGVPKVMVSDEHEVPGPKAVQQSELPWPPKSPAQTPNPLSGPLLESQGAGPMEDPKMIVSEVFCGDQQQTQLPQEPDLSTPTLNTSPPHLLEPQGTDLTGASSEIGLESLHESKALCYNMQQRELSCTAETTTSCLSLHTPPEPQGTGLKESPRVTTPYIPQASLYDIQEKEPPWAVGPPAPVLDMNSQTEPQEASPIEGPKETVQSWDIMQTQPPWTPILSSFPQAEPQGANSEGTPVPLPRPELPRWEVQQICPRHNTSPLEPPSQTWPTSLRVPAESQENEHHPPGPLTGGILPMATIVTSPLQEALLHTQGTLGPGTEGSPWNRELGIHFKKSQHNPNPHSLTLNSSSSDLYFPRAPAQQDLCSLAPSSCPPTCQNPALSPTSQGAVGIPSFHQAHLQTKKALSQNGQSLNYHPPAASQLELQELTRNGQRPVREGREAPLIPPQAPDLQATKFLEPQSLSQYNKNNMAAAPMLRARRRARLGVPEKPEPLGPDKSQAKPTVLGRKREHSRKPKAGDQGRGDAGWGVSPSKGKSHSLEGKKLPSRSPARRALVPPHQRSRCLCQDASRPELPQPSKAEPPHILSSQGPLKRKGGGRGDHSGSRHQQSCPQGGWGSRKEAGKEGSSSSSGPARKGIQKFLGGFLNGLSSSQRPQSTETAVKLNQVSKPI